MREIIKLFGGLMAIGLICGSGICQEAPAFNSIQRLGNGEVSLQLNVPTGKGYRLQYSVDAENWLPVTTLVSTGLNAFADSRAPYIPFQLYRAVELTETNVFTGDHIQTSAGEVIIHPVQHASFVISWNGKMIYNDPVGGSTPYRNFPRADLILVSHNHTDHYDNTTLASVRNGTTKIIVPQAVYNSLTATLKSSAVVLTNGASTVILDIGIEAVPAYNPTYHPKGTGNGYILTIGDKRFYMSGDTGDTVEMKALQNIDVAFLCINLPYTMSLTQALGAVRSFRPRVVYPYHFRNMDNTYTDLESFKRQLGTPLGTEVRIRKWY